MLQRGAAQAWLLHIPWLKKNGTTVPDKVKAHSFHFIIALEFWAGASLTMSIQISFHFRQLDFPRKLEYFDVPPSTAALKHARRTPLLVVTFLALSMRSQSICHALFGFNAIPLVLLGVKAPFPW